MSRWAERLAVGAVFVVFVLAGVVVWAVVIFRGMLGQNVRQAFEYRLGNSTSTQGESVKLGLWLFVCPRLIPFFRTATYRTSACDRPHCQPGH